MGPASPKMRWWRGASGVVIAGREIEPWPGRWSLTVDDGLAALWELAAWHRSQFSGRMVAVTGSVGKTMARLMIDTVLQSKLLGITNPKNYNNHVGLPLSLLQIEHEHEYAAIELGASASGEIAKLTGLCRPEMGVITRIGEAHLAGFGTQEQLARCEGRIARCIARRRRGGVERRRYMAATDGPSVQCADRLGRPRQRL